MKRVLYICAVYSGVRALGNLVCSRFFEKPGATILHGRNLCLDEVKSYRVKVHARSSKAIGFDCRAGMVSVHLLKPGIPSPLYLLLRLTSHFGCGHIEMAFFESEEKTTFYAVRNILRSNLERVQLQRMFELNLLNERDEINALRAIMQELSELGCRVDFADPEECVSYAVSPSLLSPEKRKRAVKSLTSKYRRISKSISAT